jgi:hypothetical protein
VSKSYPVKLGPVVLGTVRSEDGRWVAWVRAPNAASDGTDRFEVLSVHGAIARRFRTRGDALVAVQAEWIAREARELAKTLAAQQAGAELAAALETIPADVLVAEVERRLADNCDDTARAVRKTYYVSARAIEGLSDRALYAIVADRVDGMCRVDRIDAAERIFDVDQLRDDLMPENMLEIADYVARAADRRAVRDEAGAAEYLSRAIEAAGNANQRAELLL